MLAQDKIVAFYLGVIPDHRGRYLQGILNWSDDELERTEDYIQWLFPLPEGSGFHASVPGLDAATIKEFRLRRELRRNMRASFLRMLHLYGLELVESPLSVVKSPYKFTRHSGNWLEAGNHNQLRITRMIRSLGILGLKAEALAFFNCLTAIYRSEVRSFSPRISEETFQSWKSAVNIALPTSNAAVVGR